MARLSSPLAALIRDIAHIKGSRSYSVLFRDEMPPLHGRLIVVPVAHLAGRQLYFLMRNFLVRNHAQQMSNAVEPRLLLVVRTNDIPRRMFAVCGLQHLVSSAGKLIPAAK